MAFEKQVRSSILCNEQYKCIFLFVGNPESLHVRSINRQAKIFIMSHILLILYCRIDPKIERERVWHSCVFSLARSNWLSALQCREGYDYASSCKQDFVTIVKGTPLNCASQRERRYEFGLHSPLSILSQLYSGGAECILCTWFISTD